MEIFKNMDPVGTVAIIIGVSLVIGFIYNSWSGSSGGGGSSTKSSKKSRRKKSPIPKKKKKSKSDE